MAEHHYKFTYFDLGGRGEVTRQIFALAGVPFEDVRVKWNDKTDWNKLKSGFAGTNDFEAFQIDEFEDAMTDYFGEQAGFFDALVGEGPGNANELYKSHFEPARDKFFPIVIERYLKKANSGFLVGESVILTSQISYADLRLAIHVSGFEKLVPHCFDKYPEIFAHKERVEAIPEIKEWIEKRPKTLY